MATLTPNSCGSTAAGSEAGREYAPGAAVASSVESLRPPPERIPPLPLRDGDEFQDHCQVLLRNLLWPIPGMARPLTTVGLTSCYRREGVTTIAARTALAAARWARHRILLVDANLAHPLLHHLFDVPQEPGLTDVLLDDYALDAAVQPLVTDRFSLLTAGRGGSARSWTAVERWAALLAQLKQGFDFVVFDLPATSEVSAAVPVFSLLEGVVLVVEHERVRWEVAQRKLQGLLRAQVNLVGVALNKRNDHIPRWLYRTL